MYFIRYEMGNIIRSLDSSVISNLRVLDMFNEYKIEESILIRILRRNPHLTTLRVDYEFESLVPCLIVHCRNLTSLKNDYWFSRKMIMFILHTRVDSLVSISDVPLPSIDMTALFYYHQQSLRKVSFYHTNYIPGQLTNLLENLKLQLVSIAIPHDMNLTPDLPRIVKLLPKLEELTFSDYYNYSDSQIIKIDFDASWGKLKKLEWEQADLYDLLSTCTELNYLKLKNCKNLTDQSFEAFKFVPHLRRLALESSVTLTDTSLSILSNYCSQLSSLSLRYVKNISDVGIAMILKNCPLLVLKIDKCQITSETLANICTYRPQIQKLNLRFRCNQSNLHHKVINAIENCRRLKLLWIGVDYKRYSDPLVDDAIRRYNQDLLYNWEF